MAFEGVLAVIPLADHDKAACLDTYAVQYPVAEEQVLVDLYSYIVWEAQERRQSVIRGRKEWLVSDSSHGMGKRASRRINTRRPLVTEGLRGEDEVRLARRSRRLDETPSMPLGRG